MHNDPPNIPVYRTMQELVGYIDEPNRTAIRRFIKENRSLLQSAVGSTNNHQWWEGGWWDHTTEVMNIANVLYQTLHELRPFTFTSSDALLVLFMHDIEKPWKYVERGDALHHRPGMKTKADHQKFRMDIARVWGIALTDAHVNGIKYAEGELDDYSPRTRVSCPLAAFAHMCDHASARMWFNHPWGSGDSWHGSHRIVATRISEYVGDDMCDCGLDCGYDRNGIPLTK